MKVEWPVYDGYGTLTCNGYHSCGLMNFPVPNPSIPYTLQCDENHKCYTAYIICPANAECNITCSALESCRYVCDQEYIALYIMSVTKTK